MKAATIPHQLLEIPGGVRGVSATLEHMRALALASLDSPEFINFARQLVIHLPQKDYWGEIGAIHAFVRDRIRYQRDPIGVELVQHPNETLRLKVGDCDDKSTLVAALGLALGIPARFVAISMPENTNRYVHVYADLWDGARWVPVETTEPVPVGWHPKQIGRALVKVVK